MVDPGPLKALSEREESHDNSGSPSRTGGYWPERLIILGFFLFMLLAKCAGV